MACTLQRLLPEFVIGLQLHLVLFVELITGLVGLILKFCRIGRRSYISLYEVTCPIYIFLKEMLSLLSYRVANHNMSDHAVGFVLVASINGLFTLTFERFSYIMSTGARGVLTLIINPISFITVITRIGGVLTPIVDTFLSFTDNTTELFTLTLSSNWLLAQAVEFSSLQFIEFAGDKGMLTPTIGLFSFVGVSARGVLTLNVDKLLFGLTIYSLSLIYLSTGGMFTLTFHLLPSDTDCTNGVFSLVIYSSLAFAAGEVRILTLDVNNTNDTELLTLTHENTSFMKLLTLTTSSTKELIFLLCL